ncbi:hypothetical protein IHE45_19G074800 [Dioscorea alata]|uniref:Uncharacterized protein n=1 Tax=Dioscorea alata TaxID=55571 RepID=A0ACB7TZ55_DIOAL|nr:hypothetical protein IHE45_19G074800 [Dioscorea alata]
MMEEERSLAKKHFGVSNIAECKGYNKGFLKKMEALPNIPVDQFRFCFMRRGWQHN